MKFKYNQKNIIINIYRTLKMTMLGIDWVQQAGTMCVSCTKLEGFILLGRGACVCGCITRGLETGILQGWGQPGPQNDTLSL